MTVFKGSYLRLWRLQIEYDVKYIFSKWCFSARQWTNCNGEKRVLDNRMQLRSLFSSCCLYYLLSSMLKPFRYCVSNFRIQEFSTLISQWVRVTSDLKVFVNWSIMVNFACLLKLWLSCWKCLEAINASAFRIILMLFSHIKACFCLTYILFFYIKCTLSRIHCSCWHSWCCGISYIFFWCCGE